MRQAAQQATEVQLIEALSDRSDDFYNKLRRIAEGISEKESRFNTLQTKQDYVHNVLQSVLGDKGDIYIFGYDALFMEDADVVRALKDAAEGNNAKGEKRGVSLIIPKSVSSPAIDELEQIAKETTLLDIVRAPYEIEIGCVLSPCLGANKDSAIWDTTEKTICPYEHKMESTFRFLVSSGSIAGKLTRLYNREEARIRNLP